MLSYHYIEGSVTRPDLNGETFANIVTTTRDTLKGQFSSHGISPTVSLTQTARDHLGRDVVHNLFTETDDKPATTAALKTAWNKAKGQTFQANIGELTLDVNPATGNMALSASANSEKSRSYTASKIFADALTDEPLKSTLINEKTNGDFQSGVFYPELLRSETESHLNICGGRIKNVPARGL